MHSKNILSGYLVLSPTKVMSSKREMGYLPEIHAQCQFREVATGLDFTTLQSDLDGKGPRGREKGVRSGSHLNRVNRQRANGHTDKHAGKQCLRQCRGGYLGPDVLGFHFRLTLLRAHGKGGEQGPSIGKQEGRVSVPQTYGCLLSLRFPSHWSSQASIFLILFPALIHSKSLMLTGVSNSLE